ncbi:MAG: transcriptional regulator [Bacteroidia bacterium]|nr:transcriptional regulator [Bacteroidia bacterium]MCX7764316.1 transcriptional regulator [Bacteroidia bacterium]MDW8058385.1 transcriptional regulator [Bacteroidia bacterium]
MYPEKSISLSEAQKRLIEVWGKLAYSWGVGPTMAQIFALLYVYPEPLDTDVIIETLGISRGNVSINLRKLIEWGLIHKIEIPSSRRSLYTAERDIWLIAANIVRKRFEREIEPMNELLEELLQRPDVRSDPHTMKVLKQIQEVLSAVNLVTQLALPVMVTADREHMLRILEYWRRRLSGADASSLSGQLPGDFREASGDSLPS